MAERSMTLSMDKMFEFLNEGAYNFYYRDINQNFVNARYQTGDRLMACLHFPDITSTLGRHLLYRFELTFRAVPQYKATNIWFAHGYVLGYQLPNLSPGSQYIRVSMNIRVPFFLDMFHGIPGEPGENFSLTTISMTGSSEADAAEKSEFTYNALKNQVVLISPENGTTNKIYTTLLNGSAPYLTIYYDDTEVAPRVLAVTGITSGYLNPRRDNPIGWSLPVVPNVYQCMDDFVPVVHETLYWRIAGASTWNIIALPDGAYAYDIPANTFPIESDIEWKLSVTDADAITTESPVYTITTTDGTSTAVPTAPVNAVEIGNTPITFTWTVSNQTGEAPSRVKVEWATDPEAETWTSLLDIDSAVYSFTADANTFPGGNIYWRVTSYNADGYAGPTSDVVTFSCVAPPFPPENVTADSAPFATISWQADVQTAYEISIDGKVVEKKFGVGVYSYQLKEPLPDGLHTIGVRVQGGYGYWSTEATTTTVIENEGEGTITAFGTFGTDASLSWECTSEETDLVFRVYRDGSLIARTKNTFFIDRFVLGQHSYEILAELGGGNYIRSAAVSGTMKSCTTQIATAAGGDWLELKLSENSNRVESFEWNRNLTLRHYAGSAYPVAEFSPYEDRQATYDCAFTTVEAARAFEKLQGQIVILKSRGGEVIIGPLTPISKVTGEFYITYQFSVSQIHWEELIDDTDS